MKSGNKVKPVNMENFHISLNRILTIGSKNDLVSKDMVKIAYNGNYEKAARDACVTIIRYIADIRIEDVNIVRQAIINLYECGVISGNEVNY